MNWFMVHVIVTIRFDDGIQNSFPGWENVYLIQTTDSETAARKAEQIARQEPERITCNDRPARLHVEGVRKIMDVLPPGLVDGNELTSNEIEVSSEADLVALVNGDAVRVKYESVG